MKVAVKDLQPNPYRNISKYPINREKVESLKLSIEDTSFWDNILARKNGEKIQIAYGHHRLIALQELGIKFVDIPVRDLTNAQMLKIMANENMDDWKTTPAVVNETVLVAKEFLDAELAKYESWENAKSELIKISSQEWREHIEAWDSRTFTKRKNEGVGRSTIHKFLNGNWQEWQIQEALSSLQSDDFDREAIEEFPTVKQAQVFKQAVRKHGVPKEKQRDYAKSMKDVGTRHIEQEVRRKATEDFLPKKPKIKEPPMIGQYVMDAEAAVDALQIRLNPIVEELHIIKPSTLKVLAEALEGLCKVAVKIINHAQD